MELEKEGKQEEPGSQQNEKPENSKTWIRKTEEVIDETTEKIHQSDLYKETGKVVESATKKIFRQAGKWWGRSEHYFKNK